MFGSYNCFHSIHINMNKERNRKLKELSLTSSQADVLFYLINNYKNKINQKDIEKTFDLSNPTVHGILKRLEIKGFIKKTPNSEDARSKNIEITDKSKHLKKKLEEEQTNILQAVWQDITPKEKEAFLTTLKKIETNINKRKEDKR